MNVMKRVFPVFLMFICLAYIAACAPMPQRGDYVQDTAPLIEPDPNAAIVYFLREGAFMGGGLSYFIYEDDKKIGLLKSGSYFIHKTVPGKHTFWAETEARAAVTLDVQAGQTYYIEGSVGMGMWAGRPELREITRPLADRLLPDLKYIRLATPEEAEAYKQKEAEQ